MKHLGLFEGIGGFSLAASWMEWDTVAWCEINKFCQTVLKYYWPDAKGYEDITKTDFSFWRGKVDIVTGGFPCQPYSTAGKRLGKEDARHLWAEKLRAVREIQPPWVVGENVLGLVNWNGGLVFEEVQADLEAEGYEVQSFVLPAAGVGAPHQRYRIWFVAYSDLQRYKWSDDIRRNGQKVSASNTNSQYGKLSGFGASQRPQQQKNKIPPDTDPNEFRLEGRQIGEERKQSINRNSWYQFPTQPPVCGRNDGVPNELDGITFSKWRNESIKAYGNAIVPQVALQIFKAIQQITIKTKKK